MRGVKKTPKICMHLWIYYKFRSDTGSRIILLTGYDTMVIFLLLFTNRKSFQSISLSLGETERVEQKDGNDEKHRGRRQKI